MEALKTDWRQAPLTERHRAMVAYGEKLTRTPWEMTEADVAGLRRLSLTDEQILAVVLVAAFFNIATRLADALGIELDPQFTQGTPEHRQFMK